MSKKNKNIHKELQDAPFSVWLNSLTQDEKKAYSGKYVAIDLTTCKLIVGGESFSEVYVKALESSKKEEIEVAMVPNVFF